MVRTGYYDEMGEFVDAYNDNTYPQNVVSVKEINEIFCLSDNATFEPLPTDRFKPFQFWQCAHCKRQITKSQIIEALKKVSEEIEKELPVNIRIFYNHHIRIESSEFYGGNNDRRIIPKHKSLTKDYIETVNARIKALLAQELNIKFKNIRDLFP